MFYYLLQHQTPKNSSKLDWHLPRASVLRKPNREHHSVPWRKGCVALWSLLSKGPNPIPFPKVLPPDNITWEEEVRISTSAFLWSAGDTNIETMTISIYVFITKSCCDSSLPGNRSSKSGPPHLLPYLVVMTLLFNALWYQELSTYLGNPQQAREEVVRCSHSPAF